MLDELFIYGIKSGIVLALLYSLYWLLLRNDTHFRLKRFTLLGIVALSLLVPSIKFQGDTQAAENPLRFELLDDINSSASNSYQDLSDIQPVDETTTEVPTTKVESQYKSWDYLIIVYVVGASLSVLYLLFQLAGLFYLIRTGKKDNDDLRVLMHKHIRHPFSFGCWIFLPQDDTLDKDTYKTIIIHEKAHLRQLHTLDILVISILKIGLWYNPFVHFFGRSVKYNHECLADADTLNHLNLNHYTQQLLNVAFGTNNFTLGHTFSLRSNISKRIKVMNMRKTKPLKTTMALGILIAIFTAFISHTSVVAQEVSMTDEIQKKAMEILNKIEDRPTMTVFASYGLIPVQGLPAHVRALDRLKEDYGSQRIGLSYIPTSFSKFISENPKLNPYGPTRGKSNVLFYDELSDLDRDALYETSIQWAKENVLPHFPDFIMPSRSHYDNYKYVTIATIPSYEDAKALYNDTYPFGNKVFSMKQVDRLPEPRGGLSNFLRNVALHAEMDESLSPKDLPNKIEFEFQIGLTGEMSLLKLASKVRGSEETQDKIYALMRQLHDNLKPSVFFKWKPGMKEGSPVVTSMKVEIPKSYLF